MISCVVRRASYVGLLIALGCQARAGGGSEAGNQVEFNGPSAFKYVEQQMGFGPRVPNTDGHRNMGAWLLGELRARADTVIVQPFRHRTGKGQTLDLRNFFARFRPQAADRILFVAH